MSLLNDPSMREVVVEFCDETVLLIDELEDILESLEDEIEDASLLESFGQKIDRVMGSAATLGADQIAKYCELGKIIGYKSSQADDIKIREVVVAILFDTLDLLRKMIDGLKDQNEDALSQINTEAFGTRLIWLSEKFKDINRSSVAYNESEQNSINDNDIDNLISSLGLGK